MHPSLKLALLMLLAVALQSLELRVLAMVGGTLSAIAMYRHGALVRKILFRSRWLLLTLLLVYAFTTPGEYLPGWDGYAPTYEGLHQGLVQAARLTIMLVGLALLLGTTPREDLMAGIYHLIQPLGRIGVSPDRFTARLWLTLHYVEVEQPKRHVSFQERFESASDAGEKDARTLVRLNLPRFAVRDWGWLMLAVAGVAWSLA